MPNKYCVYISGLKENQRGDFYDKETATKYAKSLLDEFPTDPDFEIVIARKLPIENGDDAE